MAAFIARFAARVSDSADAVARSLGPVDIDGTTIPATTRGSLRLAELLRKSSQDIHYTVTRGSPFRLSDIHAYVDALRNLNGGVGIDDRKMLLEKFLVLMSRLPADSQFAKSLQVFVIDTLFKDLPHPPTSYLPSNPYSPGMGVQSYPSTGPSSYANGHAKQTSISHSTHRPYAARSADGSGYSSLYPGLGAAGKPYARTVPSTHPVVNRPDAGLVFDTLLARRPSCERHGLLPSSNPDAQPGHSTLPPTNALGFSPHPGGLSSLFFAFADLVIHSVFNTSHSDWSINNASSYLDLSPLYGSSESDLKKVRRFDGTGKLWEDVFADERVLFMPPSVPALLVLFSRNHNYITSRLLTINESGTYISGKALETLSEEDRKTQDDELFSRARLVNCGWFMQVTLGDYVGAILGLVRDGCEWRLDPLAESRELDHTVSARGQGNAVSLEFNLLYRWHAALSERDTAWTELTFEELFGTREFKSITTEQFQKTLARKLRPDPDVRKWTFDGADNMKLIRDPSTGAFDSSALAALLQTATESRASAFKARGIPDVLRVVEIMGIEQARQWETATINEFRKFMGLKPFSTFSEWNSDPEISKAAESLYGDVNDLELYPGLLAEEAKPPIPGAGLCPGYTVSRAILADAVALVRGDRFLTTDFTVYNLTSWGYLDCFPQKNDGAYGGMLTRLLYRTLSEYYPVRSSYARFPFIVPDAMHGYLNQLTENPVAKYDFNRPKMPARDVVVGDYEVVRAVLANREGFRSCVEDKLASLFGVAELEMHTVYEAFDFFVHDRQQSTLFEHITTKLIVESASHLSLTDNLKCIDVVRDVINLVPVYFVATELLGIPLKTQQTPRGLFRDTECVHMFADVCAYVFLNRDRYLDWVLCKRASSTADTITNIISEHLERLSGKTVLGRIADSLVQWYTGEGKLSDAFLSRILQSTRRSNNVTQRIFAALVPSVALYSRAIIQIIDFFLGVEQVGIREEVVRLAHEHSVRSDEKLFSLACEALRLDPPVSSVVREDIAGELEPKVPGQRIYLSIVRANLDQTVSGGAFVSPNYENPKRGLFGLENHGLTSDSFLRATVPNVLRAIFKLKDLQRLPGPRGTLRRITETTNGCPEVMFLNEKSEITPFPTSMFVQYEP